MVVLDIAQVMKELQSTLISELYAPDKVDELLEETPEIVAQRKQASAEL